MVFVVELELDGVFLELEVAELVDLEHGLLEPAHVHPVALEEADLPPHHFFLGLFVARELDPTQSKTVTLEDAHHDVHRVGFVLTLDQDLIGIGVDVAARLIEIADGLVALLDLGVVVDLAGFDLVQFSEPVRQEHRVALDRQIAHLELLAFLDGDHHDHPELLLLLGSPLRVAGDQLDLGLPDHDVLIPMVHVELLEVLRVFAPRLFAPDRLFAEHPDQ